MGEHILNLKKATGVEVLEMALKEITEGKYEYEKKAKHTWKNIEGSIKNGKRSREKEIDKVVYGV